MTFKEFVGSVNAIVSKKDCNNPNFQVSGSICKPKKLKKIKNEIPNTISDKFLLNHIQQALDTNNKTLQK